jgi:hypothetical protein
MAQDLSVNDYLIEEHRKLSAVIPEILTALTIPKNDKTKKLIPDTVYIQEGTYVEPDINKIMKMTQAVKVRKYYDCNFPKMHSILLLLSVFFYFVSILFQPCFSPSPFLFLYLEISDEVVRV